MGGEDEGLGGWPPAPSGAPLYLQKEDHWTHFDNSVNAISFGFVATAILISMFLVMAIFEKFLRTTSPALSSAGGRRLQSDIEAHNRIGGYNAKLGYPSPKVLTNVWNEVTCASVGHAWDLPSNTFGAAYTNFMGSQNFSPDDRTPVLLMETEEIAYVATRAREVHDFWHTLFHLSTNLIGESALKVIEFDQMLLPMCALSVVGGTARFSERQRKLFYQQYFPWAIRAGMISTDLMCVCYECHFEEDLEDVRQRWGIIPAPRPSIL